MVDTLRQMMVNDYSLASTQLRVRQTSHVIELGDQADVLAGLLVDREQQIRDKDEEIQQLKDSIQMSSSAKYAEIARTIGEKYHSSIEEISISDNSYFNLRTKSQQTIPTIYINK